MSDITFFGHQATRHVAVSVEQALSFMSQPQRLGQWSLGCFNVQVDETGLIVGESLFGQGKAYVRIEALNELGLIRFWVGGQPDCLSPRILATVVAYDASSCLVSLIAYRQPEMADARWLQLMRTHETELDLIKAQLETNYTF